MNIFFSLCAILGGLLRMVSSFIPYNENSDLLQLFYIFIDLCLILSLVAYYHTFIQTFHLLGHLGIIIAIIGFSLIAGPDANIFNMPIYQIGTPIIGLGLLLFSSEHLACKLNHKAMAICFMVSVISGLTAMLLNISALFAFSGCVLGLAFILMGTTLSKTKII